MKFFTILFAVLVVTTFSFGQTWYTDPANGHEYAEIPAGTYSGWLSAEAAAVSYGGHLVSISDAAENDWLIDTFDLHGGTDEFCWIGLSEVQPWFQDDRTWAWSSGESVAYTNWGAGEPSSPAEHYVAMDGDGWWRDLSEGNWPPPTEQIAIMEIAPSPEPATLGVLALGLVALIRRRR